MRKCYKHIFFATKPLFWKNISSFQIYYAKISNFTKAQNPKHSIIEIASENRLNGVCDSWIDLHIPRTCVYMLWRCSRSCNFRCRKIVIFFPDFQYTSGKKRITKVSQNWGRTSRAEKFKSEKAWVENWPIFKYWQSICRRENKLFF